MRTRTIAAAMLLIAVVSAAEGHSWYDKNCCHDKTVIRSRVKKLRKSETAGFGATRRPNNATGFRTIA